MSKKNIKEKDKTIWKPVHIDEFKDKYLVSNVQQPI